MEIWPRHEVRRSFIEDGGTLSGIGLQGAGSKPPQAARVSVVGKRESRQVWLEETNVSKSLMTCRNEQRGRGGNLAVGMRKSRASAEVPVEPAVDAWLRPLYSVRASLSEGFDANA